MNALSILLVSSDSSLSKSANAGLLRKLLPALAGGAVGAGAGAAGTSAYLGNQIESGLLDESGMGLHPELASGIRDMATRHQEEGHRAGLFAGLEKGQEAGRKAQSGESAVESMKGLGTGAAVGGGAGYLLSKLLTRNKGEDEAGQSATHTALGALLGGLGGSLYPTIENGLNNSNISVSLPNSVNWGAIPGKIKSMFR